MQQNNFLINYSKLNDSLASTSNVQTKLKKITACIMDLSEITDARIINLTAKQPSAVFKHDLPDKPIIIDSPGEFILKPEKPWDKGPIHVYPLPLGVLLLKGLEDLFTIHKMELSLLCGTIKDTLEKDLLSKKVTRLESFVQHFKKKVVFSSDIIQLMESLKLPFYISDTDGRFIYAGRQFLDLVGYSNLEQINQRSFFDEPERREEEIELLTKKTNVSNFSLTINKGDNQKLSVHDSAILLDSFIFGVFFDVTEFSLLNQEIWETLKVQESLNDRIIESAKILQKTQSVAIQSFARLAEYRDAETGEHLQRIRQYCNLLTSEIMNKDPYNYNIREEYVNDMAISSMLHDIGKVGVPDGILLKPGKLSSDEWKTMKKHTIWGWTILNKADRELGEQSFLTLATCVALHHHERYDGTGYPHELSGEDIPLSARIVSIADVYDALTTKRPYKDPWTHEQAIEEIARQTEKQFCPILVDILLDIEKKFKEIREKFPE